MVQLNSNLKETGSAPAVTVTDTELKLFAKIDGTGDDTLISLLNTVATAYIEDLLNITFVQRTYTLYLDCFPSDLDCNIGKPYIEVQKSPLVSITSIQYIDTDGDQQTLAGTEYEGDVTADGPGRIIEAYDKTWPATRNKINAVEVVFIAGYANAAAVPEKYKQIVKLYFTHLYEHRESFDEKDPKEVPKLLQALINQYRIQRIL